MANVADIRKGPTTVKINLGDKDRTIHYDLNSFAELEIRFGSVQEALKAFEDGKMANIKFLLWAGLIHEEVTAFDEVTGEPTGYNITPYGVGRMVTPAVMPEVTKKISEAMGFTMPDFADPEVQAKMKELGIEIPEEVPVGVIPPKNQ